MLSNFHEWHSHHCARYHQQCRKATNSITYLCLYLKLKVPSPFRLYRSPRAAALSAHDKEDSGQPGKHGKVCRKERRQSTDVVRKVLKKKSKHKKNSEEKIRERDMLRKRERRGRDTGRIGSSLLALSTFGIYRFQRASLFPSFSRANGQSNTFSGTTE